MTNLLRWKRYVITRLILAGTFVDRQDVHMSQLWTDG